MNTSQQTTHYGTTDYETTGLRTAEPQVGRQYALRRDGDRWQLTFAGRQSAFKHELGALYVAYLLLDPPREPIHGVALAVKAREKLGQPPSPAEALYQRVMGLEDAESVRALWRRQRVLERVLEDRLEVEPVKAEALRELEEITERLRLSPWLSRKGAERSARAVAVAIKRLHARLAAAVDARGRTDVVLRAFALHLHEYLLVPSGRGGSYARGQAQAPPSCFIYVPPRHVVWGRGDHGLREHGLREQGLRTEGAEVQSPQAKVQGLESKVLGHESPGRAGAVDYLGRFLCAGFAAALLATGCAGPRPLKGGRAATTHRPAGIVEQTLVQGENPSQASKQTQETIKVRTYTVPAGSRVGQVPVPGAPSAQPASSSSLRSQPSTINSEAINLPPSTLNLQPSTSYTLSAPMPVVEREESRSGTELGAAQKDTARELGARLASLKGIVWVGVGLFVFGIASLVWPPLKAVVGSVTTSAAVVAGGLCLMILPSLIVGNELLILGSVAIAVGGWFLAHRHGQLSGRVAASAGEQTKASKQSSVTSNQ